MDLWKYSGKRIRIITDDGQTFEGIAADYTSELDNPDGFACISIGSIEFEENEIASIEIIPANIPATALSTETRLREARAPAATG